jgi:phosphate transport system protein
MSDHTVKAFTEELDGLVSLVSRMGGMAEKAVIDSIRAITRRDTILAKTVIAGDKEIDALQREIEIRVMRILALRHPMAKDLRQTVAALKLASDIERIGDMAKNIARRSETISEYEPIALTKSIDRMGKLACAQLKQVLDAYNSHHIGTAISVWFQDEELDDHYASLFRELLTYMMEDPRKIGPATHMLFVAKNIERIGDHCTNMAEVVHYLETGEELVGDRPKGEPADSPNGDKNGEK